MNSLSEESRICKAKEEDLKHYGFLILKYKAMCFVLCFSTLLILLSQKRKHENVKIACHCIVFFFYPLQTLLFVPDRCLTAQGLQVDKGESNEAPEGGITNADDMK